MIDTHRQFIQLLPIPFDWFMRWAVYCVAGIGYFSGLFLVQNTPASLLLLTGISGAWIVIYHISRRHPLPCWSPTLFCLACASFFIPFPISNISWLPILPTMSACLLTMTRPRLPGLLAAGALWLGTSLALSFFTRQWDIGGQMILLISFRSTCGCTATISELAVAHEQLQEYSVQVEELSVIRERNRIAREIHDTLGHALTNIRQHAHATKVLLRLSTSDEQEEQVELTVLDNGQGCPSEQERRASGFGLPGMRERVSLLDGTLRAGSEPAHGWCVEVVLPLRLREQVVGSAMGARETREKV